MSDQGAFGAAPREAGSRPRPHEAEGTVNEQLPFDHIVVVMMENHSFDNLLGAMPLTNPAVDGLTFEHGVATDANPGGGQLPDSVTAFPLPNTAQGSDVSQTWADAHAQINGGRMDGFVRSTNSTQPMGYYTPETLPFAYSLASKFTVGNRWFCSLPGPTYPNRRFLLAGTAYGCTVTDSDSLLQLPPANGTIFDLLSRNDIDWTNYFSDIPMTMVIPSTIIEHIEHHKPIDSFFADCKAGTLPAVSFVDPRIGALSRIGQPIAALPALFQHFLASVGADLTTDTAATEEDPQDMYDGEAWAHQVVSAVVNSPVWKRTLLIYIYDEHGGYYDHVPPPRAPIPDDVAPQLPAGTAPASYNLYGPRVPAVVVSPYSKPGGVTEVVHDHTSVLATIEHKWNLPALTNRDANAAPVFDFLDFSRMSFPDPVNLTPPSLRGPSGPVTSGSPFLAASAHPTSTTSNVSDTEPIDNADAGRHPEAEVNMDKRQPPTLRGEPLMDDKLIFLTVLIGIAAVLIAFIVAVVAFHNARNPGSVIPAVVGVVTAAIGTLVGAVVGHAAGAKGKEQADARASRNERDAVAGRALAKTMISRAHDQAGIASRLAAAGPGAKMPESDPAVAAAQASAESHANLAKEFFPDLT